MGRARGYSLRGAAALAVVRDHEDRFTAVFGSVRGRGRSESAEPLLEASMNRKWEVLQRVAAALDGVGISWSAGKSYSPPGSVLPLAAGTLAIATSEISQAQREGRAFREILKGARTDGLLTNEYSGDGIFAWYVITAA